MKTIISSPQPFKWICTSCGRDLPGGISAGFFLGFSQRRGNCCGPIQSRNSETEAETEDAEKPLPVAAEGL